MKRTWKPTVAGILCIIAGAIGLIPIIEVALDVAREGVGWWVLIFALPAIVPIVPIVGGINALRRKRWGLAVAGSILSLIGFGILALLATLAILLSPILVSDAPDTTLAGLDLGIPLVLLIFAVLGVLPTALLIMGKREFDQAREFDKAIELNPDGGDAYSADR